MLEHAKHFLPGEHPHVDNALINHLVSKGERRCRCSIFGLKESKKTQAYDKQPLKAHDAVHVIIVECLSCTCPDGRSPIRTAIPVTGTPCFSTSKCFKLLRSNSSNHDQPQVLMTEREGSVNQKKYRCKQTNTQRTIGKHRRECTPEAAPNNNQRCCAGLNSVSPLKHYMHLETGSCH